MNRCSYFIENRALFGCFPDKDAIPELLENNVKIFVDLTTPDENIPHNDGDHLSRISFPIEDKKYPRDWIAFSQFLIRIEKEINSLKNDEKLYLHCRGGHGRSGIVVACLLCRMRNITPEKALELTNTFHNNRKEMKEKWRKIGSPQNQHQKDFVIKFFRDYYFYRTAKIGNSVGFSMFSHHPVITPLGKFKTSEAAYQAEKVLIFEKDEKIKEISIKTLENFEFPLDAKRFGKHYPEPSNKEILIFDIFYRKFSQNPEILQNLLRTGFRPIVENHSESNFLGKILTRLKFKFFDEL